jgi:hypothetical protein
MYLEVLAAVFHVKTELAVVPSIAPRAVRPVGAIGGVGVGVGGGVVFTFTTA